MKIVLDTVVPHEENHLAYIQLHDDAGKILATATVVYDGAGMEDAFKQAAISRFKSMVTAELNIQRRIGEVREVITQTLSEIDVITEIGGKPDEPKLD
jgi:uncharacterized protein YciI